MDDNKFIELDYTLFNTTTNLQYIYLGTNYLKRLPLGLFGFNSKLEKIGLENNFLEAKGLAGVFLKRTSVGFMRFAGGEGNMRDGKMPVIDMRFNAGLKNGGEKSG